MAKLADRYESIVVISAKLSEEEIKALIEKFQKLIETNATLVKVDEWGKRRLAYAINYETEGFYTLFEFDSKPDFPQELERVYRINDGVLRYLTVKRND
ncbi:MAG: 30S ribosomal protein S6 [Oscillospiraceae bacterium]|nr:30S ribosomal protein S6 [Oscillospiraceae bacterium]